MGKGVRCRVTGRVQGVWYRGATQTEARRLQLQGWVRNLEDGRVELQASGDERDLQALVDWLWYGPPAAEVTDVDCEWSDHTSFDDFTIR